MKKNKLTSILLTTPVALATVSPVLAMTSCSQTSLLQQLEQATIEEFKGICNYCHSSDKFLHRVPYDSNVMALSNYLVEKAKMLTMNTVYQDKFGNIWFDVEANDASLVDAPTIALQAHMDMVFTYDPNKFEKTPDPRTTKIEIVEEVKDGKRVIHSKDYKTTIGADDSIGVAAILALLNNREVKHGKLRIIFTNCEENAMQGAMLMVKGYKDDSGVYTTSATAPAIMHNIKYVLNLDGGLGDTLSVGCSGATGGYYRPDADHQFIATKSIDFNNRVQIKITGLDGGHSGGAVRQFKGNAVKAAVETLVELQNETTPGQFQFNSISTPGTTVYNRVPSDCTFILATNKTNSEITAAFNKVMKNHSDCEAGKAPGKWIDASNAKIEVTTADFALALKEDDSKSIINLLNEINYGRDEECEKVGQKTSANMGPANLEIIQNAESYLGNFTLETYSRSDSDTRVTQYQNDNIATATKYNFLCIPTSFPAWSGETNKKLFNLTATYLKQVLGYQEIKQSAGHGGIEPAAWAYAMENNEGTIDGNCVSIGINVADEHEVTETIDVESIQPCHNIVMNILAHANELK